MQNMQLIPGETYLRNLPVKHISKRSGKLVTDYTFCTRKCIFKGYESDGRMKVGLVDDGTTRILSLEFSDNEWITADSIMSNSPTVLNELSGQMVRRVRPTSNMDFFACNHPVKLISATQYHVVVVNPRSRKQLILDVRFADPGDWIPAYPTGSGKNA